MSRALFIPCMFFLLSFSHAQGKKGEHLLDGTSVDYIYKDEGAVHVNLSNGQFHWHWTSGPGKGDTGSAPYRVRKIGDKIYMVNFEVAGSSNFVTIVFDFGKKVFHTSALLDPKTKKEQVLFESGAIKQLTLKEN